MFKVGDKVRAIISGQEGGIIRVNLGSPYPFLVKFRDDFTTVFRQDELKHISSPPIGQEEPGWNHKPGAVNVLPNLATLKSIVSAPTDPAKRKAIPMATGLLDYFPDALMAVAELSKVGNDQHNPGQPLHWSRDKSSDHPDCILRHMVDRGTIDTDGVRHSTKVAWRALAMLQLELEKTKGQG